MSIKLDNIYCSQWKKFSASKYICENSTHFFFKITDSIHYNTLLTQDYSTYDSLIKITDQKEHSINNYKKLQKEFNINKINKIKLKYNFKFKKYIIEDGVHRLSILLFKNIITDSINIKYLDIQYDKETINAIKKELKNTIHKQHYNGWSNRCEYGYHSYILGQQILLGQRNPVKRLNIFRKHINFNNKNVIDFGCNTGGMILHLPEIKNGIGFDYDKNCISVANYISNIIKYNNNTNFYVHDFDKQSITELKINFKPDIIFLLSMGSWVKKWKELYNFICSFQCLIVFETNNDTEGLPQLNFFRNKNKNIKLISNKSSDDITNNKGRKTYIIV